MLDSMKKRSIEYHFSYLNVDSGFDVKEVHQKVWGNQTYVLKNHYKLTN